MANVVTIYHTPYCPYCIRARALLDQLQVPYEAIDVSGEREKRVWLREVTGSHTVPQIFILDRPIGGCDELFELHAEGNFLPQVEAALGSS